MAFYPKKFCQRVVQLWKASDESTPRKILKKFEEAREAEETNYTCDGCNSTNPIPTCPNYEPEESMPVVHELMQDIPEDDEGNAERSTEARLQRVHRNLGHPSNRLLVQILKEAKAPDSVVEVAKNLQCPICARHVRTSPARPANPFRAREFGHTVAMGFSFRTTPNREKLMVLHFIDEASKYHTAQVIREGKVNNYSDLGNCDAPDLIKAISEWARYMQHPSCFHVDEEGCFHSEQFKDYCGLKAIEIKMAAGEARWQNGIVERRIGTVRELLNKLLLEDSFEGATNQTIVDSVCEAKNRNGTYNGTSPSQWLLGRIDTH